MKKSLLLGLSIATLALGGVAFGAKPSTKSIETKADDDVTVYCAILGTKIGSKTLKVNANIGDGGTWRQYTMTATGETYENRLIYTGTISVKYGGVDALQFQIYNGSSWVEQNEPYSSYTTSSVFSGKMYVYDTGWVNYQHTSVYLANASGVAGDELEYNSANDQYEGVLTAVADNTTFKLKKTTGATDTYPATLDSSLSDSVATSDGELVTIKKAGAYMVYYKSDGKIWIQSASEDLVAYAYAGYFLTHTGCDPDGKAVPTGWSDLATRYAALDDDVKDYIYGFDVGKAEAGDDIAEMIERYEWAINHNPNSLSHFIVDHEGNERTVTPSPSKIVSSTMATSNDSAVIWTVALVSVGIAALLATTFIIRKRRQN